MDTPNEPSPFLTVHKIHPPKSSLAGGPPTACFQHPDSLRVKHDLKLLIIRHRAKSAHQLFSPPVHCLGFEVFLTA